MAIATECVVTNGQPSLGKRTAKAVGIIIPTYNAERHLPKLSASLAAAGVDPSQVLVIDSSSTDATLDLVWQSGYRVLCIPQKEFNHGTTRQLASSYFPECDQLLFCTQDIVLQGIDAIDTLLEALDDPSVGAAYGRQIPREEANAIERHARLFNYPETSQLRTLESRLDLGLKAVFFSNSFAMYRRSALEAVGGFPMNVLLAEDSFVAGKMLLAGWNIAYKADAVVIHSHPLQLGVEFRRYFDTGAHHARTSWLLEAFGKADSAGRKFFESELRYLLANSAHLIPLALLRTASKLIAYRLGTNEHRLPLELKRRLSSDPHFWLKDRKEVGSPNHTEPAPVLADKTTGG